MTLEQDRIDSYAALVVHVGAHVQPGQEVLLQADVAHREIARTVAEQAYAAGASRVRVEYYDPYVRRSALRHAPEAALTSASRWELDRLDEWTKTGLAFIRLTRTVRAGSIPSKTCGSGLPVSRMKASPVFVHSSRRSSSQRDAEVRAASGA